MITSVSFFQSDLTLLSVTESPGLNSRLHRKLKWSKYPFLLVEGLFLGKEQMRRVGTPHAFTSKNMTEICFAMFSRIFVQIVFRYPIL